MTGAAVQNRAVPLQACGPREPNPRQVDILLDNSGPVICKIQWQILHLTLHPGLQNGSEPMKYSARAARCGNASPALIESSP